jgi:nicotinamidase-related amidase
MSTPLPIPEFYQSKNADRYDYQPDASKLLTRATEWRREHDLTPAASDKRNVHLLMIDVQKDFSFPEGSLYVGGRSGSGAVEDNQRLAEFIYRNLASLTNVTATMDTHFAFQIFSPSFWIDQDDRPLTPFREVTTAQIDAGEVRVNPAMAAWMVGGNIPWLMKQVRHYCATLEAAGKYQLYLWPAHCLLGSPGHALAGIIQEARLFHSFTRSMQSWVEVKGGNALTENYSVLRPEVLTRHDGLPLAQRNTSFLQTLLDADAVLIAGQAASHCVKSSIDDLLKEILAQDPDLARKVYILKDCMSSVTVPDGKGGFFADFTPEAEAALDRFQSSGMHVVRSTDPLDSWLEL